MLSRFSGSCLMAEARVRSASCLKIFKAYRRFQAFIFFEKTKEVDGWIGPWIVKISTIIMGTMNAAKAMPILARRGLASPPHEESQRPTTIPLPYLLYCIRLINCSQNRLALNKTFATKIVGRASLQATNKLACFARSAIRPQ